MSSRSIYLRDQAAKYVAQAEEIESKESGGQHARQMKEPAN